MRSACCRWFLASWFLVLGAAGLGCGNDQDTINRVQPNALEKSMFEGEWYTKGTIIDTQIDAPIYVGSETLFDRITWEIQEQFLIAKRSYELVRGAEGEGLEPEREDKSVIAVFKILKHFDIRREYNPATGEETNVISENDLDRPWYEREYMRVDWSQNVLDGATIPSVYASVPVPIKGVALFAQDTGEEERSQLAPHFEHGEDGKVVYFDLVNRYWAEPAQIYYDDDGDGQADGSDSACLFIQNSQMDCQPGAVAIRHSFARVEDRDYQPNPYTEDRMSRFGYFLNKRDNYDPHYGATVGGREIYAMRHNLWMQSHQRDEEGTLVGCRNDGHCQTPGSVCDLAWGTARGLDGGACTLPYRERAVRPIRYYLTANTPVSLIPAALTVGQDWNVAFTETVASMLRLECEATDNQDCAQHTPDAVTAQHGPVFAVCRNPVTAEDAPGCGEPGFSPRFGDIRYNIISWVSDPHSRYAGAPLGLGPSASDPMTGEVISGVANLYGDGFDQLAAQARDILAMMQGDLPVTATQSNAAFEAWLDQVQRSAVAESSLREADRHVIPLDGHDMAEANADMDFSWALRRLPTQAQPAPLSVIKEQAEAQWKRIGAMHEELAIARQGRAKLSALRGTWLEDLAFNDEYNAMLGLEPGAPLSDAQRASLSPFSDAGAFGVRGAQQARSRYARTGSQASTCLVEAGFLDEGLLGLLREIDRAVNEGDGTLTWYGVQYNVGTRGNIDYELVMEMVKQPIFFGLLAHEIGHTLGLRHNFSGSYDALNYHQAYWDLRDDGEIRSRAFDPMSRAEIDGRIRELQYSTVMDYGHNFVVSDAAGVGHYDVAAIKMGYGDVVEVFTDAPAENVQAIAELDAQASPFMVFQVDPRSTSGNSLTAFHYSSWPELVGGTASIGKRRDVRYRDLQFVQSPLFGSGGRSVYDVGDGTLLPIVPYLYCGDEFANSRPPCNTYDAGADPYEVMQSMIDAYWNYYPFSHFMRGRIGWDSGTVPARSFNRYFAPLTSMTHIYALYREFFEPFLGTEFFEAENGFGLYTAGVRASYDLFRRIIATPEPASQLTFEEMADGTQIVSEDGESTILAPVRVDAFNGRYLRSYFDIGPSREWIFFSSSGWFKEKQLALDSLMFADTGYLGVDTSPDVREYSSSYYTIFPDSMGPFLKAIFASDLAAYGPRSDGAELTYPAPQDIVDRGANMTGQIVSPNVAFTLQLSAMAYGMLLIPNTFDQDFVNRARLFVAGSSEAVDLDSLPGGVVSYADARSGLTYQAGSYPRDDVPGFEGQLVETGPGAAMVQHANALAARVAQAEADGDAEGAARWQAKLVDFVDNMDILRYLTSQVNQGSDGEFLSGP